MRLYKQLNVLVFFYSAFTYSKLDLETVSSSCVCGGIGYFSSLASLFFSVGSRSLSDRPNTYIVPFAPVGDSYSSVLLGRGLFIPVFKSGFSNSCQYLLTGRKFPENK